MFSYVAAEARIDPGVIDGRRTRLQGREMKECSKVFLDEAANPRGERSIACAR